MPAQATRAVTAVLSVLGFGFVWSSFQKAFYTANYIRMDSFGGPTMFLSLGLALLLAIAAILAFGRRLSMDFTLRRRTMSICSACLAVSETAFLVGDAGNVGSQVWTVIQAVELFVYGIAITLSLICWVLEMLRIAYTCSLASAVATIFASMLASRLLSIIIERTWLSPYMAVCSPLLGCAVWLISAREYSYSPEKPDDQTDQEAEGVRIKRRYGVTVFLLLLTMVSCELMFAVFGPVRGDVNGVRDVTMVILFVAMLAITIARGRSLIQAETARLLWFLTFGCVIGLFAGFLYSASVGAPFDMVRADASFTAWSLICSLLFFTLFVYVYEMSYQVGSVYGLLFLLPLALDAIVKTVVLGLGWSFDLPAGAPSTTSVDELGASFSHPAILVVLIAVFVVATGALLYVFGSSNAMKALVDLRENPDSLDPADTYRPNVGDVSAEGSNREAVACSVAKLYALTPREQDILLYLSCGYSVKRMANILHISTGTVQTHMKHLYAKMDVHSRNAIIDMFEESGCSSGLDPRPMA